MLNSLCRKLLFLTVFWILPAGSVPGGNIRVWISSPFENTTCFLYRYEDGIQSGMKEIRTGPEGTEVLLDYGSYTIPSVTVETDEGIYESLPMAFTLMRAHPDGMRITLKMEKRTIKNGTRNKPHRIPPYTGDREHWPGWTYILTACGAVILFSTAVITRYR